MQNVLLVLVCIAVFEILTAATLTKAAESVKIMNAQVTAKKVVVDEKKRSIEELISSINEKSSKASQRKEEARATERQISQVNLIQHKSKHTSLRYWRF